MSKITKIGLGAVSLWPALYFLIFSASILVLIITTPAEPAEGYYWLIYLVVLHLLTIFLLIALAVYYIVHAYKNPKIDDNKRVIWVLLLLFGGIIAMPVYWYIFIWSDSEERSTNSA